MSRPDLNEQELLERIKKDPSLFSTLYESYVDRIYNFIFYRTLDHELSQDLAHEVFCRVIEKIESYQDRGNHFSAWIFRIARNLLIDHYRWQGKRSQKETPLEDLESALAIEDNPVEKFEMAEVSEALLRSVSRLNDNQREAIILRYQEGLSNREIGRILEKSEGAIKVLIHRALENLRKDLKDDEL